MKKEHGEREERHTAKADDENDVDDAATATAAAADIEML